jgi:hypothetical protein
MIIWREGKAGFVGGSKRLIKGVFSYIYTAAGATALVPDIIEGIISSMTSDGFGTTGIITADGDGIASMMSNDGIISTMTDYGDYALSTITIDGNGITSTF